jgi:hypothetical protein
MTDAIVRAVLEEITESSKTENFSSIVVSVTTPFGNYFKWTSGKESEQIELIAQLYDRMRGIVDNWKPFDHDPKLDASYACYHMGTPSGFDFLTWLMMQEIVRADAENAPGPLKVAFWQGRHPQPSAWLDHVFRPLVKMIGAVEDDAALRRMGADVHVTRSMVALYKCGAKIPKLRAVGDYDLPKDVVTITLRECDYHPHRNSDLLVWYEFSKMLRANGEHVVFVRDTAKANEPLTGCETSPLASRDLDARMWLYEHAKLNFFVSNGPMMLAALTENVPYITFVMPEEMDSTYDANKPTFWKLKMGVQIGEQFPWARAHQRIVWEKPTFKVIDDAYWRWRAENNLMIRRSA